MIQKVEIQRVLEYALDLGIEFAEVFLEDKEENNIPCIDQSVQGIKSIRIYGDGWTIFLNYAIW